jgi:hypothetical protein
MLSIVNDMSAFLASFSSKSTIVASHNCIYNLKAYCNQICNYKSFLLWCNSGKIWTQVVNIWVNMDRIPYNGGGNDKWRQETMKIIGNNRWWLKMAWDNGGWRGEDTSL